MPFNLTLHLVACNSSNGWVNNYGQEHGSQFVLRYIFWMFIYLYSIPYNEEQNRNG